MGLLLLQCGTLEQAFGYLSWMPIAKCHSLQIVEHCLRATPVDLFVEWFEVGFVLQMLIAHFERRIAPLMTTRRDHPTRFCQHHDVQAVADLEHAKALWMNRQGPLGNHRLQASGALLVFGTPECLVCD